MLALEREPKRIDLLELCEQRARAADQIDDFYNQLSELVHQVDEERLAYFRQLARLSTGSIARYEDAIHFMSRFSSSTRQMRTQ